jgi:hypothetical protein
MQIKQKLKFQNGIYWKEETQRYSFQKSAKIKAIMAKLDQNVHGAKFQ